MPIAQSGRILHQASISSKPHPRAQIHSQLLPLIDLPYNLPAGKLACQGEAVQSIVMEAPHLDNECLGLVHPHPQARATGLRLVGVVVLASAGAMTIAGILVPIPPSLGRAVRVCQRYWPNCHREPAARICSKTRHMRRRPRTRAGRRPPK